MILLMQNFRLRWVGLVFYALSATVAMGKNGLDELAVARANRVTALTQTDTLRLREAHAVTARREIKGGAPTWRLDSTALRQRGVVTTADALRRLPSVNLRDYGGAGGLKTVSVRGMGASHTVVTHDGLPVGDARMGQIDLRRFPLHQLRAVTLSVADASELLVPVRAMGAATIAFQSQAPRRGASLQTGAWGTIAPSFAWRERQGSSTFGVVADAFHSDNDYPFTQKNYTTHTRERRQHSRMETATTLLSHRFSASHHQVVSQLRYRIDHRQLPGPVVLYTTHGTERLHDQEAEVTTRWQHIGERTRLMAAFRHAWQESKYTNLDGQYSGGRLEQFYWQRETYATLGAQTRLSPKLEIAYIADLTHVSLNSNLRVDNHVSRLSLQQALSLRLRQGNWTTTLRTLHHLHHNRVEETANPPVLFDKEEPLAAEDLQRLTVSFSLSGALYNSPTAALHLHTYAQELFRLPTFTETYYYHYGNRRLRPERTRQLGIGVNGRIAPKNWGGVAIDLSVDAYHNRVSDRILAIPLSLHLWRTLNLNRVRALGTDATLSMQVPLTDAHHIALHTHYSLQSLTDRSHAPPATMGKQLPYTPLHSGSMAVAWQNPWLHLVLTATASGERWATHEHAATTRLPAYTELGASLSKHFRWAKLPWEVRFDIMNLTNVSYEIIRRYPMPSRSWRIAVATTF